MSRLGQCENADAFVIGSEPMLEETEGPEIQWGAPRTEEFRHPEEASRRRKPPGRVVAAGAIVAIVAVAASALSGRGGGEPSGGDDRLVRHNTPSTRGRVASAHAHERGETRADGAANPQRPAESESDRGPSRVRKHDDGVRIAPGTGPIGEGTGGELAPAVSVPPVVESVRVPASPPAASASRDASAAAPVAASGAQVRQEFGP